MAVVVTKGGGSSYLVILAAEMLLVLAAGNITGMSGRRYNSVFWHTSDDYEIYIYIYIYIYIHLGSRTFWLKFQE